MRQWRANSSTSPLRERGEKPSPIVRFAMCPARNGRTFALFLHSLSPWSEGRSASPRPLSSRRGLPNVNGAPEVQGPGTSAAGARLLDPGGRTGRWRHPDFDCAWGALQQGTGRARCSRPLARRCCLISDGPGAASVDLAESCPREDRLQPFPAAAFIWLIPADGASTTVAAEGGPASRRCGACAGIPRDDPQKT